MERALASFHSAVAKDYGFEDAARAAEDWIEELGKACTNQHPDWRSVTARARTVLRCGWRNGILMFIIPEMSSS